MSIREDFCRKAMPKYLFLFLLTLLWTGGFVIGQEVQPPADPGLSFYLTVSGGGAMPSDALAPLQLDALNAQAAFGIMLDLGDFDLALGGTTGIRYFRTVPPPVVPFPYYILTFPLAAQARLSTKFNFPIQIFVETSVGASWNSVLFLDGGETRNAILLYGNALAGFGLTLSPNVRLAHYIGFTLITFPDPVYFSVDPGARIEITF